MTIHHFVRISFILLLLGASIRGAAQPNVLLTHELAPPNAHNELICRHSQESWLLLPLSLKEHTGSIIAGVDLINCSDQPQALFSDDSQLQLFLEEKIGNRWTPVSDLTPYLCCVRRDAQIEPRGHWAMRGIAKAGRIGRTQYRFRLLQRGDLLVQSVETSSRRLGFEPLTQVPPPRACAAYPCQER